MPEPNYKEIAKNNAAVITDFEISLEKVKKERDLLENWIKATLWDNGHNPEGTDEIIKEIKRGDHEEDNEIIFEENK